MDMFKEIPDNAQCPCGSGKQYGNCCKKKNFKYAYQGEDPVKQVPISDDIIPLLNNIREQFQNYYGRLPGDDDFVVAFAPVYNDELLLQSVYMFRELNFPENKIYAYYKSDGLFPCDLNTDLLPETNLKEFKDLCSEYDELICSPIDTCSNAVQFVLASNSYLQSELEYMNRAIISSLNDFIHRHCGANSITSYQMKNEVDYLIFSALKTIKTLRSVEKLMKDHLPECIYALGRGIFENYMYICNINADPSLFQKKLHPKVDRENYTFGTTCDGKINYNRVINKNTGEKQNVKIVISDLVRQLPYKEDHSLYDIFYKTACQYVHVDVMSAKSYFSVSDPYDEIDPSLIAGLVISTLAVLLLSQIGRHKDVQEQFKSDINYLCNKNLNIKLTDCLNIANSDPEHQNEIFDLLLTRLKKELL